MTQISSALLATQLRSPVWLVLSSSGQVRCEKKPTSLFRRIWLSWKYNCSLEASVQALLQQKDRFQRKGENEAILLMRVSELFQNVYGRKNLSASLKSLKRSLETQRDEVCQRFLQGQKKSLVAFYLEYGCLQLAYEALKKMPLPEKLSRENLRLLFLKSLNSNDYDTALKIVVRSFGLFSISEFNLNRLVQRAFCKDDDLALVGLLRGGVDPFRSVYPQKGSSLTILEQAAQQGLLQTVKHVLPSINNSMNKRKAWGAWREALISGHFEIALLFLPFVDCHKKKDKQTAFCQFLEKIDPEVVDISFLLQAVAQNPAPNFSQYLCRRFNYDFTKCNPVEVAFLLDCDLATKELFKEIKREDFNKA